MIEVVDLKKLKRVQIKLDTLMSDSHPPIVSKLCV